VWIRSKVGLFPEAKPKSQSAPRIEAASTLYSIKYHGRIGIEIPGRRLCLEFNHDAGLKSRQRQWRVTMLRHSGNKGGGGAMNKIALIVNGEPRDATNRVTFERKDPMTGKVATTTAAATVEDVKKLGLAYGAPCTLKPRFFR
jgi:hypothetical protein